MARACAHGGHGIGDPPPRSPSYPPTHCTGRVPPLRFPWQLTRVHAHFGKSVGATLALAPVWARLLERYSRDEPRWLALWLAMRLQGSHTPAVRLGRAGGRGRVTA